VAGLVFHVPDVETELGDDDLAGLKRELGFLARDGATYDAAGARARITLTRRGARVDLEEWPHAEVRGLARALDHLWNLDRAESPPPRHRPRHELREYVAGYLRIESVTYERVIAREVEIFHSYTGPYEAGDRVVDLSGLTLRVTRLEAGDPLERLICERSRR
jgi:hypothetical protein